MRETRREGGGRKSFQNFSHAHGKEMKSEGGGDLSTLLFFPSFSLCIAGRSQRFLLFLFEERVTCGRRETGAAANLVFTLGSSDRAATT